jgi:hypothetical protein
MFTRIIWWAAGASMGAVGSAWAQRKLKRKVAQTAQHFAPPAVAERVKHSAKNRTVTVVDGVRNAVDTGRQAAMDREAELRDRYRTGPNS